MVGQCICIFKCVRILPHALNVFKDNTLRRYCKNFKVRNPYDVLGLKSSCTTQDVKKAYIKLCKELHPDAKPGDSSQHKKFVELNQAYTTLVNAESRTRFDSKVKEDIFNSEEFQKKYHQRAYGPYDQGRWEQDIPWYETEEYKEYFHNLHKGQKFKDVYRIRKAWIVIGCFLLVAVGSLLYFTAYSYATSYTLQKVDRKSREISENYNDARKVALEEGREERLSQLRKRWSS